MKLIAGALVCLCLSVSAAAQAVATGSYPFASFDSPGFDSVNLGNLNVRFSIPIVSRTGRGLPFVYTLQYEGLVWTPVSTGSTATWVSNPAWGLTGALNGTSLAGYLTHTTIQDGTNCVQVNGHPVYQSVMSNYVYYDPFGAAHSMDYTRTGPCTGSSGGVTVTGTGMASDSSGYKIVNANQIQTRDGKLIVPGLSATGQDATSLTDTNGNFISKSAAGGFTDTTGVTALSVSGSSPITLAYPVTLQTNNATTASAAISYGSYMVKTSFQCSNISDYTGTSAQALVNRVTLADGSYYAFTYEATPGTSGSITGRLKTITLPTGGVITYAYTGGCNGSGINPMEQSEA